ncbi:hypothetical protein PG987_006140 [Apiospora arundinis]
MIRSPENVEVMLNMTRRCQTVDQEAVNWMRNVPEHWHWKTVAWEDNVPNGDYSKIDVYHGCVDVYHDFYIASVWNMARTARLILASLIVRSAAWVCAPIDFGTTPEYATASRTCMDTITDIIASVPYHLGWHGQHDTANAIKAAVDRVGVQNAPGIFVVNGARVGREFGSRLCSYPELSVS